MTISCFPKIPNERWFKLAKLLKYLGIRPIGPTKSLDQPRIWITNKPTPDKRRMPTDINGRMFDSSKRATARMFREVFGYDYEIDPECHEGIAVEKSDLNGYMHGRLVTCPMKPNPKMFYSRFLGGQEWRVQFYGAIMCVTRVWREKVNGFPARTRTPGTSQHNVDPYEDFAAQEVRDLVRLAKLSGMDYGGMDVIRDKDGKIYVVDLNPGPSGPYRDNFPSWAWSKVIPTEAEMFRQAFLG